jgi:NAD(P)-dependent dehydrogenase (short-subunit alcohol dehydrogenase family)
VGGELSGKSAVVTGSTQGLGAAIARAFVREGARVVLSGRSREKGEALARDLAPNAVFQTTDLRKVEDCRALVARAREALGPIDILVNSAALSARSTLETFTPESFDEVVHTNLRAPLLLAQAALPDLIARGGAIVNIGSINAYMGEPSLLVYAATKGALQTASRNLAHTLKHERVRVYCLNCGWIDTDGERAMMASLGHPPDFIETHGKVFPLGRILKPEEVAEVVVFLASDRAAPFSGQVIELEQFPTGPLGLPTRKQGVTT